MRTKETLMPHLRRLAALSLAAASMAALPACGDEDVDRATDQVKQEAEDAADKAKTTGQDAADKARTTGEDAVDKAKTTAP
jgi:hypothetical protein